MHFFSVVSMLRCSLARRRQATVAQLRLAREQRTTINNQNIQLIVSRTKINNEQLENNNSYRTCTQRFCKFYQVSTINIKEGWCLIVQHKDGCPMLFRLIINLAAKITTYYHVPPHVLLTVDRTAQHSMFPSVWEHTTDFVEEGV